MKSKFTFSRPRKNEIKPLLTTVADALLVPREHRRLFIGDLPRVIGQSNLWVVRSGKTVAGGGGILRMGQFWGGKRVPCAGVTIVGISPEYRGKGAAHQMMVAILEDESRKGTPLSNLYASTMNLYRKSGYEVAADRIAYELETRNIGLSDRECDVVKHEGKSTKPFKSFYSKVAGNLNGALDRHKDLWDRILKPETRTAHKYIITRRGRMEGYLVHFQECWKEPITVADCWFSTPAAGRRILTLLQDLRSVVGTVKWWGGPRDQLLHLMDETRCKTLSINKLMLRIVNVKGALEARGYPRGLDAELHFAVEDDILPSNSGNWVLTTKNGRGRVKQGGSGRIRTHIRRLAQLYAGYALPAELALMDEFGGQKADLATAAAVFAGPAPWTPDMF